MNTQLIQENFKNKLLNKYYQELHDDLYLNIANLQNKNLNCSATRAKWLMYLTKEKENKKHLKQVRDELKTSINLKNQVENNKSILSKKNNDSLLNDEKLQKLNETIEQVDETVIFLEYAWNILNDFGYNIKNVIEYIKLEQV